MIRFVSFAIALLTAASAARAWDAPVGGSPIAQPLESVRVRYARDDVGEVPDFQQHVTPLFSRLGCNGRACHGSFQGQGGLRLSLFGYDFAADHQALLGKSTAEGTPRVDRRDPAKSLALRKPTLAVDHGGGEVFDSRSWEYRLLLRWIEGGAAPVESPRRLERLEVAPAELVFAQPNQAARLKLVAHWEGGVSEDVTELCRFQSNDDAVAAIDRDGKVQAAGRGDTHVVAFYDKEVVAVPVTVPVTALAGDRYPPVPARTRVDELIVGRLRKLGIVPSELCTDAEFLRRASLDITGTLPAPAEVEAFLADAASDKRARKIDELLERPAYAAWWANRLCDYTGCSPEQQSEAGQQLSVMWYEWLHARLRENVPYDELVERIVLAEGRRPGQSYAEHAREMSSFVREGNEPGYADRETLPLYWSRRTLAKPRDKGLAFAHAFLGIRLQCAECHKHPFDRWTKQDFGEFSGLFGSIQYGVAPGSQSEYEQLAKSVGAKVDRAQGTPINPDLVAKAETGNVVPWRELHIDPRAQPIRRVLGQDVPPSGDSSDPRAGLMRWLRQKDNPWFARAFVNRVWANYFHKGIIEPTDDLNPANPACNEELLDYLAEGFIAHGYDMKWLHREIANSDAYQRSWKPNETNRLDRRHFSRAIPRRLPAEIVYDALKQATAADAQLDEVRSDLSRRAIGHLSMRLSGTYAMMVFGKPSRATNCDCERVSKPSLLQAVFLQNDPILHSRLSPDEGWLAEIAAAPSERAVDELVRQAYLRTLSRPPKAAERERAARHVAEAGSTVAGMQDLLWALLNTKEFLLIH